MHNTLTPEVLGWKEGRGWVRPPGLWNCERLAYWLHLISWYPPLCGGRLLYLQSATADPACAVAQPRGIAASALALLCSPACVGALWSCPVYFSTPAPWQPSLVQFKWWLNPRPWVHLAYCWALLGKAPIHTWVGAPQLPSALAPMPLHPASSDSPPRLQQPRQRLQAHRCLLTSGQPASQLPRCFLKCTSTSQATLGCLSCTVSRLLCLLSCAQSISVTGKACCCVSSLTLTTKSTSDVSSKHPSCSWPEPLTRTTSRAMWTSGLPRDWSIFLFQKGKGRREASLEKMVLYQRSLYQGLGRSHSSPKAKGSHQSDYYF